jgi:hypothetical protein
MSDLTPFRLDDVGDDASDDDEQCTKVVEVVVHQINEVTDDEQQCAKHDEDDAQVLFQIQSMMCFL